MSLPHCDSFLESQPAPCYNVLVVDDEEDVRKVTKLCLKGMRYNDVPVKVTEAASKAEAIELVKNNLGQPYVAAIIDVVMESDHAGLELVDYIRKDLGNASMSIYLRTGQPGQAPEREVMEKMELDGYILKTDLTDEKLYSITLAAIKSTLRSWAYEQATLQLSLFSYGTYQMETLKKRIDMGYALADRLADKPSFAIGHYYSIFDKKYSSSTGKAFTEEMINEMRTLPVKASMGASEYRTYKNLHIITSQVSESTYMGHHIVWPDAWITPWLTFFQIFDHFILNTRM